MSKQFKILVISGDGIGPEVTFWGRAVLEKIGTKFGCIFEFEEALLGAIAIDQTGKPLPPETLEKAKKSQAILFGAIGDPKYDNDPSAKVRPEQGLLQIRQELGLFANIRPIQLFDELLEASSLKSEIVKGTDILFFRELTGGIYFGKPRERRANGEIAVDTCIYSKAEVRRIAKLAFEAARNRQGKVTSVDKANVLETSRLWRETVNEVAKDYPEITLEHQFVDSMAMKLLRFPRTYDVVLTENMFGDILTDEASEIAGSLGMLASASIGEGVGLFEPIHGSAPDIAGQNKANPLASILSVAMLLDIGLGLHEAGQDVVDAVKQVLANGWRTQDIRGSAEDDKVLGTKEMGQKIVEMLS